jgi:hypothetical protein
LADVTGHERVDRFDVDVGAVVTDAGQVRRDSDDAGAVLVEREVDEGGVVEDGHLVEGVGQ